MSERKTVTGVLHGSIIRKQRGLLLDRVLIDVLIDMGRITYDDRKFFYAPRYYLTDANSRDDLGPVTNKDGKPYRLLSFKGQPKALSMDLLGHYVEVRATLEDWRNGIGAHLLRPADVTVSADRAPNHECDSPRACRSQTKTQPRGEK